MNKKALFKSKPQTPKYTFVFLCVLVLFFLVTTGKLAYENNLLKSEIKNVSRFAPKQDSLPVSLPLPNTNNNPSAYNSPKVVSLGNFDDQHYYLRVDNNKNTSKNDHPYELSLVKDSYAYGDIYKGGTPLKVYTSPNCFIDSEYVDHVLYEVIRSYPNSGKVLLNAYLGENASNWGSDYALLDVNNQSITFSNCLVAGQMNEISSLRSKDSNYVMYCNLLSRYIKSDKAFLMRCNDFSDKDKDREYLFAYSVDKGKANLIESLNENESFTKVVGIEGPTAVSAKYINDNIIKFDISKIDHLAEELQPDAMVPRSLSRSISVDLNIY